MAQNELQIVTFEQAKRLKAAGFDGRTEHTFDGAKNLYSCYCDMIEDAPIDGNNEEGSCGQSAPTVALALKGFRDVKGYVYSMVVGVSLEYKTYYHPIWSNRNMIELDSDFKRCGSFAILDEAESALLDALLDSLEASETACE